MIFSGLGFFYSAHFLVLTQELFFSEQISTANLIILSFQCHYQPPLSTYPSPFQIIQLVYCFSNCFYWLHTISIFDSMVRHVWNLLILACISIMVIASIFLSICEHLQYHNRNNENILGPTQPLTPIITIKLHKLKKEEKKSRLDPFRKRSRGASIIPCLCSVIDETKEKKSKQKARI